MCLWESLKGQDDRCESIHTIAKMSRSLQLAYNVHANGAKGYTVTGLGDVGQQVQSDGQGTCMYGYLIPIK